MNVSIVTNIESLSLFELNLTHKITFFENRKQKTVSVRLFVWWRQRFNNFGFWICIFYLTERVRDSIIRESISYSCLHIRRISLNISHRRRDCHQHAPWERCDFFHVSSPLHSQNWTWWQDRSCDILTYNTVQTNSTYWACVETYYRARVDEESSIPCISKYLRKSKPYLVTWTRPNDFEFTEWNEILDRRQRFWERYFMRDRVPRWSCTEMMTSYFPQTSFRCITTHIESTTTTHKETWPLVHERYVSERIWVWIQRWIFSRPRVRYQYVRTCCTEYLPCYKRFRSMLAGSQMTFGYPITYDLQMLSNEPYRVRMIFIAIDGQVKRAALPFTWIHAFRTSPRSAVLSWTFRVTWFRDSKVIGVSSFSAMPCAIVWFVVVSWCWSPSGGLSCCYCFYSMNRLLLSVL